MAETNNPWEKALLTAGASNAGSLTMRGGLENILNHKCPRCGNLMGEVFLASKARKVMYCNRDRVVVPIKVTGD